jgi:hypothetical protein
MGIFKSKPKLDDNPDKKFYCYDENSNTPCAGGDSHSCGELAFHTGKHKCGVKNCNATYF